MDAFPGVSLAHNAPLVLITGLSSTSKPNDLRVDSQIADSCVTVKSELPAVDTPVAAHLKNYFASIDSTNPPWDADYNGAPYRFRTVVTGRTFKLPSRKATLPPDIEVFPQSPPALHSPFSPLSTTSRLYPDGIMNVEWIRKHQELIPSVCLTFYSLTSDPAQAPSLDQDLITDIANIRTAFQTSGHKTRLVAILLNDANASPSVPVSGITDRLESIRRGSGLDSSAIFYVAPKDALEEYNIAADKILTSLYPGAVEYYRDLGRRSKKKKNRGMTPVPTIPPTSGTSQTLTLAHWNVRYDFKIGVFAEFRQDMDTACRAYETAYDGLTGREVWEMIPGWGTRWNEARYLADIIAIRHIRCLLWNGQPSAAVRRWQFHRDLTADMVDRYGRGTNNYGWEAWESRWYLIMAQVMENMSLPDMPPFQQALFLPPEKTMMSDRLRPWDSLHHTGYWYRAAAHHQAARRRLAFAIPPEDREKPEDPLEAHKHTQRDYSYDTYLCPEPYKEYLAATMPTEAARAGEGPNHAELIVDCLMKARKPFEDRGQTRAVAEMMLDCARELTALGKAGEAVAALLPLWKDSTFRESGWINVAEDICWSLRRAAVKANRPDIVLSVDWELLHNRFSKRPNWPYDLSKSLEGMQPPTEKPTIELNDEEVFGFLSPEVIFRQREARAGETCYAELQVTTNTFPDAATITLKELFIEFEGGIGPVTLTHDASLAGKEKTYGNNTIINVDLNEEITEDDLDEEIAPALSGSTLLTFKPAHTTIFHLPIPLREPGETQALAARFVVDNETYSLSYIAQIGLGQRKLNYWLDPNTLQKSTIARDMPHVLDIQPRPPKMDISLVTELQQYYTNEPLLFDLLVSNAEDEDITAKIDVLVTGPSVPSYQLLYGENSVAVSTIVEEDVVITNEHIGKIVTQGKEQLVLRMEPFELPGEFEISIKVSYHLDSDPATPIIQTLSFKISPTAPFEARYELLPRLHPEEWPSVFRTDGLIAEEGNKQPVEARGLAQRWLLKTAYQSLATEEVIITGVDVHVLSFGEENNPAVCQSKLLTPIPAEGVPVKASELQQAEFQLDVRKLSLDDRTPSLLELAFDIHWTRAKKLAIPELVTRREDPVVTPTSSIVVPPYLVLGTEPRVLASLSHPPGVPRGLMTLVITIENASSHFLTFSLTMDPSDQFAFSGAKLTTVNVLPVSRRRVEFRLWPLVTGTYIRPGLIIKDKYYQKILRVIGTENMTSDKEGLLIWVPQVEEE